MVNSNAVRLLFWGLVAGVSATLCAGQATPGGTAIGSGVTASGLPSGPAIMAQAPPNPPKVSCRGNELTIAADNSTLGSILAAIHNCTGVQIDIPESASNNRSFDHLGPGPAREVLTALLSGTDFNYVIGSSMNDPEKVESVLILSRTPDKPTTPGSEGTVLTAGRRAWQLTQKTGRATYKGDSGDDSSTDGSADSQAPEQPPASPAEQPGANASSPDTTQPPVMPPDPSLNPSQNAAGSGLPQNANPNQSGGTGIQDRITSMQQLFEQRRQMMQNQPNNPKP